MKLHTLVSCLHDFPVVPKENPEITSIEADSRKVTNGSLFVCMKGYTVDSHDFAKQAAAQGAAAIVAERPIDVDVPVVLVKNTYRSLAVLADYFYEQPTHKLHLIGITGTNGKTTTSHIMDEIMRAHGHKTGLIGTINMKIGDETFEVKNTTPDALTLQQTFHRMVEKNVNSAVMEVSSHALSLGRVHGCDYDVAVFTNLTQDHLDYHKTMEEYKHAKGLLFAQLGNSYHNNREKYAVLNSDDPVAEEYMRSTAATVITYGIDTHSDIMAKDIVMTSGGTTFTLVTPSESIDITMKLIGKFNVYNVLAAIAATLVSGVSLQTIVEVVKKLTGVPGRFEVVDGGQDYTVIVDYAHTPDSLENVLTTAKQFAKGNVYCIVGCGGDRDRTKRPIMAGVATEYATHAILTSDNPRSEDPKSILDDMLTGAKGNNYEVIIDRKEAIFHAVSEAKAEDIIIIAGKGHETYQIIGKDVHHFDDREIAKEAINERLNNKE
ncbi:UDP-N-acetylmuramoyl-L-alanyl-D-glutamate--2,6-diaminopimelate ligase [Bacillus cereus]|uniref:UDP-N-acetylmuramoyl-L-alanyl-D-glutamate--2,6-diaminopimelate ligase n=1 Tax=Bacillus arachidis TaxID=2819290 RepID=A0ABS3NVF7_9BACI|nr:MULTISPECIES: UDP-N-acetylmuramoyl-L-alanyl-D-glutamate--2,6-diaminopimelate ligase [Bacillus]MBO1624860.1 UDP-N-acetylmuramoyl-L-alanyl-D-glutamate--2,6-diaminopimelate ligase [Bacillus arachidis]PFE05892.1 UDP-N-acetylmuramoyl-L-alanyl-D-glutamate--2,6-diaminopimelate ligase [Bacillus sp. AFS023182]PGY04239.1 UDP-N-acetylmuramoyl-L-alanyl-D-glutamate--2,6-diaminopimelate ligase [Bacillus cereus]